MNTTGGGGGSTTTESTTIGGGGDDDDGISGGDCRGAYDPDLVDDILSRHILSLSIKDRTEIQEEIHGAKCLAPIETPEFIYESLRLLQIELDINYNNALLLVQQQQQQQQRSGIGIGSRGSRGSNISNSDGSGDDGISSGGGNYYYGAAYIQCQKLEYKNSYINTNEFKLRFLRCELFDNIPKIAIRIIKFLDFLVELFGLYALKREIRITDFTRSELTIIRKGHCQFLPFRDNIGRRIILFFPNHQWENTCPIYRNKLVLYLFWIAGKDINTQRKGIILLGWFESYYKISVQPKVLANKRNLLCQSIRVVSVHCCTPDTPFYRLRRATLIMRSGPLRSRLQMHLGEPIELQYALSCFGIPGNNLPITSTGSIKTNYLRQWIRLRKLIESSNSNNSTNTSTSTIVECPYLNDVLLRQGNNTSLNNKHMGNMNFQNLIKIKLQKECYNQDHYLSKNGELIQQYNIDDRKNIKTRKITNEIINEIITGRGSSSTNTNDGGNGGVGNVGGGGRFLSYNNEYNGWYHMTDPEQIYLKVEYICRELRFEMKKKNSKKLKLELALALALESSSASNTNTDTDTDNKTTSSSIQKRTKSPSTTTNMQTINSSTSIFQFQQHGNSEWGGGNTCSPSAIINICTSGSKRQKTDFSSINNNNDCNDDDNNINNNNNQNIH